MPRKVHPSFEASPTTGPCAVCTEHAVDASPSGAAASGGAPESAGPPPASPPAAPPPSQDELSPKDHAHAHASESTRVRFLVNQLAAGLIGTSIGYRASTRSRLVQ